MRYKKAQDLFPEEIIALIQQYVDGEYIYIPRKPESKKAWGETSLARKELQERNKKIYDEYELGLCKNQLAERYFLSEKSIERILLNEKHRRVVL